MVATLDQLTALIWPATLLGIAALYRAEIRQGLGRLSTIRYRGFEVGFREELDAAGVVARVAALASPPTTTVLKELNAGPNPTETSVNRLRRIAELSPRVAILEAWHEVETAGLSAATAPASATWAALADRLHALHDRVASSGLEIDRHLRPEEARQYADLAQALIAHHRGR